MVLLGSYLYSFITYSQSTYSLKGSKKNVLSYWHKISYKNNFHHEALRLIATFPRLNCDVYIRTLLPSTVFFTQICKYKKKKTDTNNNNNVSVLQMQYSQTWTLCRKYASCNTPVYFSASLHYHTALRRIWALWRKKLLVKMTIMLYKINWN